MGLTLAVPSLTSRQEDRKSTRLNSSHVAISYAVFCLKKKNHRKACDHNDLSNGIFYDEEEAESYCDGTGAEQHNPHFRRLLCGLSVFNDTATTEIYTLSLHDALPI